MTPQIQFKTPTAELISSTENSNIGAMAILIFTKSTRLKMTSDGFAAIYARVEADPEWAKAELSYMSRTIRSSWEFIDYTFLISNVSRGCAQQMTRTRQASFAMQSQRVTNMSDSSFHMPSTLPLDQLDNYTSAIASSVEAYGSLVDTNYEQEDDYVEAASLEDARNVLPIGIHCNLVLKMNLRTLAELIVARSSGRVQEEYRTVVVLMREAIFAIHPWAREFIRPSNEMAIDMLKDLQAYDSLKSKGTDRINIMKIIDLLSK